MKNIVIAVPAAGVSVQLVLRAGASLGQAVIVASDDVEIRYAEPAPAAAISPKSPPSKKTSKTATPKATAHDLDTILKRLLKLKPTTRVTAINSIKTMFQFDAPINDETASKILDDLRKRGSLTIDANDKIQFHNA